MKVTLTSESKEVTQEDTGDYTGEAPKDQQLPPKPRHQLYQSAVVRSRTIKEGEKRRNSINDPITWADLVGMFEDIDRQRQQQRQWIGRR